MLYISVPLKHSFIERKGFGKASGDFALMKKFLFPKCPFLPHPEETLKQMTGVSIHLLGAPTHWVGTKSWGDLAKANMVLAAVIIHLLSQWKDVSASGFGRACMCLLLPRSRGLKALPLPVLCFPSCHFHWTQGFSEPSQKHRGVYSSSLCFCCVSDFTFPSLMARPI